MCIKNAKFPKSSNKIYSAADMFRVSLKGKGNLIAFFSGIPLIWVWICRIMHLEKIEFYKETQKINLEIHSVFTVFESVWCSVSF